MARRPPRAAGTPRPAPPARGEALALPFSSAYFRVLIGGTELGFSHVSRLHLADAAAAADGGPGAAPRPPSVVLKRAITQDRTLYRWRERVAAGKRELRTITIQQRDVEGERVLNTWVLHGCRPVRWSGPEFNAIGTDLLWEELEVSCERIEWVTKESERGRASR